LPGCGQIERVFPSSEFFHPRGVICRAAGWTFAVVSFDAGIVPALPPLRHPLHVTRIAGGQHGIAVLKGGGWRPCGPLAAAAGSGRRPWGPRLKTRVAGFSFIRPKRERGFFLRGISRPLSPSCLRAKGTRIFSRAQDPTAHPFLPYITSKRRTARGGEILPQIVTPKP